MGTKYTGVSFQFILRAMQVHFEKSIENESLGEAVSASDALSLYGQGWGRGAGEETGCGTKPHPGAVSPQPCSDL